MARRTIVALVAILVFISAWAVPARAQSAKGEIRGTVTDQTGALIPGAQVAITGEDGKAITVTTGRDGAYRFAAVTPGMYQMVVTAKGFADAAMGVEVDAGKPAVQDIKMQLPVEQQQVTVTDDAAGVSTAADANTSAIVIKGKDLDALSDDPDELQNELNALAGPPPAPTARRYTSTDLPAASFRPSRPSARSGSIRIRSRRTLTSWATAALKF